MKSKEKIDSKSIQTELNRLKESQPNDTQGKASLFNLVVYAHDSKRLDYFKKIVDLVMDQFPCRIIFIQSDEHNTHTSLEVRVPSNSKGTANQICVTATGEGLDRVPFLIFPHLIPDLPIYLFWSEDLTKDAQVLPFLKGLATRIIIDSENTEDLQQFSQSILKQLDSSPTELVDMNWVRIAGWRQIISRAFDSKDRVNLLRKATSIRIVYNDLYDPHFSQPKTQAIYLQAWLSSCLGWNFEKARMGKEKTILYYVNEDAIPIRIDLEPQLRKDLPPEEIIEVEISDPKNYDCIFSRKNISEIGVKASNQYQCLLPFTLLLPNLQSGRSFMQEIFYQRISNQYPKVLKMISQLNWS